MIRSSQMLKSNSDSSENICLISVSLIEGIMIGARSAMREEHNHPHMLNLKLMAKNAEQEISEAKRNFRKI